MQTVQPRPEDRIEEEERMARANESSIRFLQLSLQLFFQWGYDSFAFLQPFGRFLAFTKDEDGGNRGGGGSGEGEAHFLMMRHWEEQPNTDFYSQIVQPLCICWTLYNLLLLLWIKCLDELSRTALIATAVINYLVALFIVGLGFIEGATDDSASREIYHRYAPFQVFNCLTVVSLFYFTRAQEPRRFSTSPGNFVWVWLFLAWSWAADINGYMLAIGLIYALITTTSVATLVLELLKGLTTTVKKVLIAQLVFSLVLTGLTEIFAVISHGVIAKLADEEESEQLEDQIAISLLQIFIIVNIVDMVFWVLGRCVTS